MTINLDLLKVKSIATVPTSIGVLSLFEMTMGSQFKLSKALGSPIKEKSPEEYFKNLMIYVYYPEEKLKEKAYKPDEPMLSIDDINILNNDELEELAKIYLDKNEYLYNKDEFDNVANDKGEEVSRSEYNEIEYPKNEGESCIHYLHRLSSIAEEKRKDRMQSIVGTMPNLGSFSKSLSGGIATNLMHGESLSKALDSVRTIPKIEMSSIQAELEAIDWDAIGKNKEKVRREPFDDLAQRLDRLITSSKEATKFLIKANELQVQTATEIKHGGDLTDKHTRRNIRLTIIAIFLTVVGLFLTVWSNFSGVTFSDTQQDMLKSYISEISKSLASSNKMMEQNGIESKEVLTKMLVSLNQLNINLKQNRNELKDVLREIELLKSDNVKHKKKIERPKGDNNKRP